MKNIYYFDELDSTNTYTASQYSKLPNYSTIVADKQTKGKGSSSRIWHSSTKNGLWFSFLIKDEIFWGDAFSIEVLGSIAVWKVLNEKGINATLKWPNDVLVNNKKISGVLVEVCGELETFKYTIIGIGLNVNQKQEEFPSCIQNIATSMFLETNTEYDKQSLLYDIVSNIKLLYTDFKKNGNKLILKIFKKNNISIGRKVNVLIAGEVVLGRTIGLYQDFSLLVELENKKRIKVNSSNITFL